jgi:hypothetical protein
MRGVDGRDKPGHDAVASVYRSINLHDRGWLY